MRMLLLSLAVATLVAQAEEDTRARKIRELLELTGALDRIRPAFDDAFDRVAKIVAPAEVERVRKEFGREQLAAVVVPLYAKHLDDETLDATLAFLRSPAGKKYLAAEERGYAEAKLAAGAWVDEVVRTKGAEHEGKRLAALVKCKEYYDATMVWRVVTKRLPESLEAMEAPLQAGDKVQFIEIEPDPWGRNYVLRVDDKGKAKVSCLGIDGVEGTEDDITYPEKR